MKQTRSIMLALVVAFGLMTFAYAAQEQTVILKAGPAGNEAQGEVVIKNKGPNQEEITIKATGLKPNAVYTVWLVSMEPSLIPFMKPKMKKAGLGEGDYSFKSDDTGVGRYSATLSPTELEKWEMLKIAHHPDGDPTNMKNMGIALNADLK